MRFKKLKIAIGIALVIFVLVVANIIFVGTSNSTNYQTPVNSNANNVQPVVSRNPQASISPVQQVQSNPQIIAPTTQRTTIVQNTRTRAS